CCSEIVFVRCSTATETSVYQGNSWWLSKEKRQSLSRRPTMSCPSCDKLQTKKPPSRLPGRGLLAFQIVSELTPMSLRLLTQPQEQPESLPGTSDQYRSVRPGPHSGRTGWRG